MGKSPNILVCILIAVFSLTPFLPAGERFQLTPEEEKHLLSLGKRPIKLAYSYELLVSESPEGERFGMLEPFIELLENRFGLTVEPVRLHWDDAFKALHRNEIDLYGPIDCLATVDHAEVEVLKRPDLRYEFTNPNVHFQQGFLSHNQTMRPLIAIINRYLAAPEGEELMAAMRRARRAGIIRAAQTIMKDDIAGLREAHAAIALYDPGMQDPLCYADGGTYKGLQADINSIFSEVTGVDVEMHFLDELPDGLRSAVSLLKSGEAQGITGVDFNVDTQGDPDILHSVPVWRDSIRMYAKADDADAGTKTHLAVGVLSGTENYAGWIVSNVKITNTYQSYRALLAGLESGEVRAIFASEQLFDYLYNIRNDSSLRKIGNLSSEANVRVLLSRGNPRFNRLMNAAIETTLKDDTRRVSRVQLRTLEAEMAAVLGFLAPFAEANRRRSVDGGGVLDQAKARAACEAIRPLLESGNMECQKMLDVLREALRPMGAKCAILLTRITDCDFELALETLDRIERCLEDSE